MKIVAIIDRNHAKKHGDALQQLISAGHRVAIIGSKEDGDILLPLVTVGLEKKVNLFLFDSEEFENVIEEMKSKQILSIFNIFILKLFQKMPKCFFF